MQRLFKPATGFAMGAVLLAIEGAASAAGGAGPALRLEAEFDHQVTGVAITGEGRRFVNFPRWTEDAPISVAELLSDGKLVPYPDTRWNEWRNARASELNVADHFVCVQSIVPDGHGHLWVVDAGAPANERVLPGAPKLVGIDLATNTVGKVILVPDDVALLGSYLNDVRFSPDGRVAYLTDSGARGAIIVIDLETGKGFRTLDGHPSTQADKQVRVAVEEKPLMRSDGRGMSVPSDGITISNDGRTLYWQALTGRTLYAIDTSLLQPGVVDRDRTGGVRKIAATHVADGLWISKAGVLYLTSPSDHSVKRLNGAKVETVLADGRLNWPDTFSEGSDGRIYVTASHIPDSSWFTPGAPAALDTQLFSFLPQN